jgi:hypothetical protein
MPVAGFAFQQHTRRRVPMKQALVLTLMSTALCTAAFAQSTPATPGSDSTYPGATKPTMTFESFDKNKDSKITKEEAKGSVTIVAAFDTADKNGDASLSKTEFDAYFSMR